MSKRLTKAEKELDKKINEAFKTHGACIEFNIMDLPKVFAYAKDQVSKGVDIDTAMIEAVSKYRAS